MYDLHLWRLLFFCCLSFNVLGQPSALVNKEIIFDQPHENLGLSQRSINCMIQDKDGYLWIGTWEGLMMYDGYSTTIFQSSNGNSQSLKSNKITSLYEDSNYTIWVGTLMGGLYNYNKLTGTFKHYSFDPKDNNSLSNNNVWSIVESGDGSIWVGTQNGLNHFDNESETFKRYYHEPGNDASLSYDFITSLFIDQNNKLWVGTEKGLNQLDLESNESRFKKYFFHDQQADSATHNYVYKITSYVKDQDGKEVICWSTKKGLKILDDGRVNNYMYPDPSLRFSFFRTLYTYQKNESFIILGSETGISLFDPSTHKFIKFFGNHSKRVNLSHNTVTSLLIDRSGVLWAGTKRGINKFDTYNKNFELFETSLFDKTRGIITGVQGGLNDSYWLSTMGGGLYNFEPKRISGEEGNPGDTGSSFKKYELNVGRGNDFTDFIQTLYTDDKGNVWIGTAGDGVYHFNENTQNLKETSISSYNHFNHQLGEDKRLTDDYIMSFCPGNDGGLWVGTWSGGLNKIGKDGKTKRYKSNALSTSPLVVIHQDTTGVLWIGTRGTGLLKMTENPDGSFLIKSFRQGTEDGLNNDFINTIYEDEKGRLWVGSEGGLNLLNRDTEKFRSYQIGLMQNDVVVGMLEDQENRLWLSHWKGLTVIDPDDSTGRINNYDMRDRIQGGFFYNNVCYKDKKGRLLFGGNNGLNIINSETVNKNPIAPEVVITDFSIYNKEVNPNEEFNGRTILNKPISKASEIDLNYYENAISFEFAALHFAAPEKNQYAYRLVGYDDNWKYINSDRRFANYTNLAHGHYTFEVKASNNDGVWNNKPQRIEIIIAPPWWKTGWAIFAYLVLAIGVLLLFRYLIILRTNYINDIRLERIERENMEKMNQSKLRFFTNISHEFRTPLTLILGPLEKLIGSGMGGKYVKDELDIINKNAQRLLRLVNQLLDFRKAESGKIRLQVAEGNIVRFVKEIKLLFEGLAENSQVDFQFHASSNVIEAWYDRDQFEKILFNLLSNAFKHVSKNGTVKLTVMEVGKDVVIKVEDNGVGIKPQNIDRIFNRFYSEGDPDKNGTGIGLAITRSLIKLHHGEIHVESEENKFTTFTVSIPLGHDHFTNSQIIGDFKDSEYIGHYQEEAYTDGTSEKEDYKADGSQVINQHTDISNYKKILIVEDNVEVRAHIKTIFKGKYIVLEAQNGLEGITIAEEEQPDLVVSDVMMPEMDGIALCRSLKENTQTSHIPIILLTARTSLIYKVEGLESGADDYITKPFNGKILELKVRNLINMRDQLKKLFTDNQTLNIEPKKVTFSSSDEIFIEKALDSIEKNMSNSEYTVEDFGEDLAMSRMQIYRKLKALTGQSANEFIRTIRLKRAAQLIERNEFTIAEVTYHVGFHDLQYFRSCFKKYFGVNPSEYGKLEEEHDSPT